MSERKYYRPLPDPNATRWQLAGGWLYFDRFEVLSRGSKPEITTEAPDEIIDALTKPRADIMGLSMAEPQIMGVMNITPDSMSDGGKLTDLNTAVSHARSLIRDGAAILDVGGESTRPGADYVSASEEINRILPVIEALEREKLGPVSVDTRKAAPAASAISAGAKMINDVSALQFDPEMALLAAKLELPVCLMHSRGTPKTMQSMTGYSDVLLDIYDVLEERIQFAIQAGIPKERIIVDPGIGFGKELDQNLAILRRLSLFHGLGVPVLLGASRKRLIGAVTGCEKADSRDPGTLALTISGITHGIQIHRVHNVADIAQGVRMWQSLA